MALKLSRPCWWGLGLFAALRASYLGQYLQLPFVFGPLFDSQIYFAQADAVRMGRFGDATLLAFSPLYGYFLTLLGARSGDLQPLVCQLVLGGVNVLLIYRLTLRLFHAQAAWWAGVCYALYGPLMFFETKIMSETLGLTFLLLAVERFASNTFAQGKRATLLMCGLYLSLAVLTRASLLFCLPFFVLFAVFRDSDSSPTSESPHRSKSFFSQRALGRSLALACVLGLLFSLYGAFTYSQSGLFVPVVLTSNTAAQATQTEWTGTLAPFSEDPTQGVSTTNVVDQAKVRLRAVARGLPDPAQTRSGVASIDILGWLRQVPKKVALTLRDQETTFDYGYYGERSEAFALRLTWMSFGLLACWAACGAWLSFRRHRFSALTVLLPIFLGILTTTTLFHPSTRYRLPLLVVFAPLSGWLIHEALMQLKQGRKGLACVVAALAAIFLIRNETRTLTQPAFWQLRVAESAAVANDLDECRARLETARRLQPESSSVAGRAKYIGQFLPACLKP